MRPPVRAALVLALAGPFVAAWTTPGPPRARLRCAAHEVDVDAQRHQRPLRSGLRQDRLAILQAVAPPPAGSPLAKELIGLLQRGDPYDAHAFDGGHEAFKAAHNAALVALLQWSGAEDVFYLDGADGATTAALRRARVVNADRLYVANPHAATVSALRAPPAALEHVAEGRAEEALAACFAAVPFGAAYLDGCGGAAAPLKAMAEALFARPRALPSRVAVGFTLTLADGGTEGPPRSLHDREMDVTRAAVAAARVRGYVAAHVGDAPERYGVDPLTSKRCGATLTWWLAFEGEGTLPSSAVGAGEARSGTS